MCSNTLSRIARSVACGDARSGMWGSIPKSGLSTGDATGRSTSQPSASTPEEFAEIGKQVVHGTDEAWPPPPNVNKAVFFGGFPGRERIEVAPREFSLGLHSAIVPVTDMTDDQLCCRFDRRYWVDVRVWGCRRSAMISTASLAAQ